jgi:hypothetical protein
MSVSDADRLRDKQRTLCRLVALVGDDYFIQAAVKPASKEFEDVLPTTWRELLDDGLIDDKFSTMGSPAFRLTAAGWLRAMLLSGTADTPECRDRCTRLAQALKSVVRGRNSHYDGLTTEHEIAAAAGLPAGWVFNAVKSRLLGVVFPKDRWDATIDKRTIRVSPTFGLNHLFEERG